LKTKDMDLPRAQRFLKLRVESHNSRPPDQEQTGARFPGWEGHGHSNCLPCPVAAHPSNLPVRSLSPRARTGAIRRRRHAGFGASDTKAPPPQGLSAAELEQQILDKLNSEPALANTKVGVKTNAKSATLTGLVDAEMDWGSPFALSILNRALGAGYVASFLADGALRDRQAPATGVRLGSLRWEKRGVVCHSQSLLLPVLLLQVMLLQVVLPSAWAGKNSIKRRSWNSTRIDCRSAWRLRRIDGAPDIPAECALPKAPRDFSCSRRSCKVRA